MSVLDKFLNVMKLNDDEEFDEDKYLDDAADDLDEADLRPGRRIVKEPDEDPFEVPERKEPVKDNEEDIPSPAQPSRFRMPSVRSKQSSASGRSGSSRQRRRGDGQGMEVCVIRPHSMEDAREITETLLAECTVVLNVEGLELEIAQRIIDFASGSCYAIDGNLQKISNYIFIITPASVDISGDFQEILSGAFDVPFESRY